MESSSPAPNVQLGGSFQNFWKTFQDKGKKSSNIGYLDVWKLQSAKMIIETKCVRFAKTSPSL